MRLEGARFECRFRLHNSALELVTRECTLSNHCPSERCYGGQSPALSHRSHGEVSNRVGTSGASGLPYAVCVVVKLLYGMERWGVLAAGHISSEQLFSSSMTNLQLLYLHSITVITCT